MKGRELLCKKAVESYINEAEEGGMFWEDVVKIYKNLEKGKGKESYAQICRVL